MKKITWFCLLLILSFGCKKKEVPFQEEPVRTNDYLSDKIYDRLKVEIAYEANMEPSVSAVNNLTQFLQKYLTKPGGIEVTKKLINTTTKPVYSFAELLAIERDNRTVGNLGNSISVWVFFAGGDYDKNTGNSKVLGIAYGGSSIVLFEKTIQDCSGGLLQPTQPAAESAVMNHEFGHVMGLVNNGTPMTGEHQDEPNGKHCDNGKCLMYYAAETSDLIANLVTGEVPGLCANCENDLKANGGK